jgi:hypothetical protein
MKPFESNALEINQMRVCVVENSPALTNHELTRASPNCDSLYAAAKLSAELVKLDYVNTRCCSLTVSFYT